MRWIAMRYKFADVLLAVSGVRTQIYFLTVVRNNNERLSRWGCTFAFMGTDDMPRFTRIETRVATGRGGSRS